MPSKALQSLIDTFENLESPTATPVKPAVIQARTAQNYVSPPRRHNNYLDSSTSPTASTLASIQPIQPKPPSSRSESPSIVSTSSLIDAQDLDFLDVKLESEVNTPLSPINPIPSVEVKKAPPPLPPRRSDTDALPTKSFLGDSLMVKHSYPPVRSGAGESGHVPASSISSFHSVSLSSDDGNRDSMNMDESLEFLSISAIPPIPARPESQTRMAGSTPKLPPRPASTPASTPASAPYIPYTKRRPPPPPPPTFQKRKPSLSNISKISVSDTKDTSIDIDAKARERYVSLFECNFELQNRRKVSTTQQKGWRSTPTTFLKGPQPATPAVRLEGHIVKAIWECSRLNKYQLRRIWAQSNPSLHSSLDLEGFIKGMWLIDEELRKANESDRHPNRRPKFTPYKQ